ncbi:MAG: threonine synthase, partial [Spirochaetae bacterium HGW-Spirochaetae-6]
MNAFFRCIDGCETHPLDEVVYQCTKCGKLLEVVHDMDALKKKSAAEWKKVFESRSANSPFPHNSGVWAKKEWVNPQLEDQFVVSLGEGNNPLTPLPRLALEMGLKNLWIKHCGNTHTGSFKDLGMTALVSQVNQMMHKTSNNIKAVACASTGDTSA